MLPRAFREAKLVKLLLAGYNNDEIAAFLGVTERTVKADFSELSKRYGIENRIKRVRLAIILYKPEVDRQPIPSSITKKELSVVRMLAAGDTNKDIARELSTTKGAVQNHLRSVYDKLGLWNRVELALWYLSREQEKQ